MHPKAVIHLMFLRREFDILDGPHVHAVRFALPLPVLITSLSRLPQASHPCLLAACRILDIRLSELQRSAK